MDEPPSERFDSDSSYHFSDFDILMKIMCEDACMQSCLKVVMSTCLAHGVELVYKSGEVIIPNSAARCEI
jgi:hypothetical protein